MKRTLLNVGAILSAFLIGLAINNACADSLENMSDSELRKLVAQLQQEVNSLKERVAQLEKASGNSSGSSSGISASGGFTVDGIFFNNAGLPECKVDYYEYTGYMLINGDRTELTPSTVRYEYDSYGRLTKQGATTIEYSAKSYSQIYNTLSGDSGSYQCYTYHLK